MIDDSSDWKSDLLRQSEVLQKRMTQRRWPATSLARCEQTIMLGFYSIRRLIESKKITDAAVKRPIPVYAYAPTGQKSHLMNRHKIDRLYALDKPTRQNVTLQYLCNQVIHSYIFLLLFDEDGKLAGVFVVSDFHRFKKLFQISLQTIVDIFNRIGNDDIARMRLVFDPLKGDYRTYAQ
jgi:hypothetical protein